MSSTPSKHSRPIQIQGKAYGVARCRVEYSDLSDADTSETLTWAAAVANHPTGAFSPPANARIVDAWVVRIKDFAGGSVTACTVSLGDAGDADELLATVDVFTGAKATAAIGVANGAYTLRTFESAYAPTITIDTTTDNIDQLTAGVLELCIAYEEISTASHVAS